MTSPINWNTDTTSSLISLGTHFLYLRAAGTPRSPSSPAIITIPGLGDTNASWTTVQRLISSFARIYTYDRSGQGNSSLPSPFLPETKTYINIAKELKSLLTITGIEPPYILIMHSLGGLIGREFLHLYEKEVVGMLFVDCLTEESYTMRPKELPRVMRKLQEGLDSSFLWKEKGIGMSTEEWGDVVYNECLGSTLPPAEILEKQEIATRAEIENLIPCSVSLKEKGQLDGRACVLGDRPVSVIKGNADGEWKRWFEVIVKEGRGTDKEREMIKVFLETVEEKQVWLQFQLLKLSRNSRMVEARESWHNVQWYQPDLIAREVKWCMEEYEKLRNEELGKP